MGTGPGLSRSNPRARSEARAVGSNAREDRTRPDTRVRVPKSLRGPFTAFLRSPGDSPPGRNPLARERERVKMGNRDRFEKVTIIIRDIEDVKYVLYMRYDLFRRTYIVRDDWVSEEIRDKVLSGIYRDRNAFILSPYYKESKRILRDNAVSNFEGNRSLYR